METRYAYVVLKILELKSFNCHIKHLEISGEYGIQILKNDLKNVVKRSAE